MRIVDESYTLIDTFGPVEISDSFVARTNKLISAIGAMEKQSFMLAVSIINRYESFSGKAGFHCVLFSPSLNLFYLWKK